MFDPYAPATITNTYQSLMMDEKKEKNSNDEIIKAFKDFIKEYRNGEVYKYRYIYYIN